MVAKSASFGHGSLVCGLWLAGGGRGGSVPTYVLGTFYIRFFCTRATIYGKIVKPTVQSVDNCIVVDESIGCELNGQEKL